MSRLGAGIYALFLALFGALGYFAYRLPYFPGDISLSLWVQGIDIPFLKSIMQVASSLPLAVTIFALVVIGLWLWGKRLEAISTASLTLVAALVSWLFRVLISRPRPVAELVQILSKNSGPGFPSGHVTCAVVFFGFLFYLIPKLVRQPALRGLLRSVLIILILLVGMSRIYLGAHWASDVLGGLLLGGLILYPAIVLYNIYKNRGKKCLSFLR